MKDAGPEEGGVGKYYAETKNSPDPEGGGETYKLDKSEKTELPAGDTDEINRIFMMAYTIKKEFHKVVKYARKLQDSENRKTVYLGKYLEIQVGNIQMVGCLAR